MRTEVVSSIKASYQHEAVEVLLRHGYIKEARIFVDSSTKDVKGYIIHPDFTQK